MAVSPSPLSSCWPCSALSPRDRRLVALLLGGRTNDEIAVALGVTRKAIEAHLGRLFERFAVASRTELAVRAEREGWLGAPTTSGGHSAVAGRTDR